MTDKDGGDKDPKNPELRRSTKTPELEKRKSLQPKNWLSGALGVFGEAVADLAVDLKDKTLKVVAGENEDEKK